MTLEEINQHIKSISQENWKQLFKLIPQIQEHEVFGELMGGEMDSNGVIQFPYLVENEVVHNFIDLMYKFDLVINFHWSRWTKGREIAAGKDFNNLDSVTLIKLLTAIIRNDRFCEGALVSAFENGTIEKILIALNKNITENNINKSDTNNESSMDIKELKKKFNTNYIDSSLFAEKARLLQSIWRTEKGYEFEKYGNFLKEDFAKKTGVNFLTKNIFDIVKSEIKNKHKYGKVIKEPRIWNNLLSSQPLAFNIFGELKLNTELATKIFQVLYPERNINNITTIEFEYSPGRRNPKYTGDKSAFDVFVEYENQGNQKGFFGIEVNMRKL